MKDMASIKNERVRKFILDAGCSSDLAMKIDLVDTLERTGVAYHYGQEIEELLHGMHSEENVFGDNLCVTAMRFYLLRKHGYNISPDVFLKFKDDQGNFPSNDVNSLLALYNAAYLRIRGEEMLDDVVTFTKNRLQSMVEHLEPWLAEEVLCTLETPHFRRVERVETRRYIAVYEKKATRDEDILEFAKFDFNILQTLYCEELKALTIWWKDLKSQENPQFARDRIVEVHFWILGVLYEPQYSYSRIMLTKLVLFMSLLGDLYDNYSTTEESNIFTAAMHRWDAHVVEQLPAYLKALYINILKTTNDIEEVLKCQENKNAEFVKKLMIDVVKCYHAEVNWRDEHYVATTVEVHLQLSMASSACMHIISLVFISLGDVTTKDNLEWAFFYPKFIRGVCIVGRIGNDMVSHEREQGSDHMVSTVQTCTIEHGITVVEANEKLKVIIEEACMDIVHERLLKKHSMVLLEKATNLARTMDCMYKREDAYTLSFSLKKTLTSLYVNFI
ncbi:(E)-beta-caryophyllene synthase-like [Aegilops tauschii subsp. strangulata]|uniref:(E)-beta-caryophyllene synthase-like n=1 Tax=Triticum aestivum TaxID=4565 RepID=UPI001D025D56|nr:(E)-beta-caryophyllene synthase-like [Triticum aestivum]